MSMFCYQCEQTVQDGGCVKAGVCGKDPSVAALQDNLIHGLKAVSTLAHHARRQGAWDPEVDVFVPYAMFTTLTNTNFDPGRFEQLIATAARMRDRALALCGGPVKRLVRPGGLGPRWARAWKPRKGVDALVQQGAEAGIERRRARHGAAVAGLQETIIYALKGVGAYLHHAEVLGKVDSELHAAFHEILAHVASEPTGVDDLLSTALKTGELNLRAMALLDAANTETFGHPEPTNVRVTPVEGKAILISGHDLGELEALLQQTEGTGINVYTNGELLPANAYPRLKAYPHLVGNYGGAWHTQRSEFADFPGAILLTTNCLMKPVESYKRRIFTSGPVGWSGVTHISDRDFAPVIDAALAQPGFQHTEPERTIPIGFARNAVMGVADKVVDAVESGAIRHFFLIGGCDGAKAGRNYYTELAESLPEDCVILTLACGKYRFNHLEFGDIGGIPRILDVGQCNDAYSAVQIALALADAFETDVNSLPLSIVCSWYEQKAVAILLSLLHLGIKGIRLGPSLPAFIEPDVLNVLVDKFEIQPISTPEEDLQAILGAPSGEVLQSA